MIFVDELPRQRFNKDFFSCSSLISVRFRFLFKIKQNIDTCSKFSPQLTKTMTKQFTFLGQVRLFILMMILMSLIKTSDGRKDEKVLLNSEDDDSSDEDRRAYELKKLRHFLLTSNADERAAKREKQDFLKRELVKIFNLKKRKRTFSFFFRLKNIFEQLKIRIHRVLKKWKVRCDWVLFLIIVEGRYSFRNARFSSCLFNNLFTNRLAQFLI